MKKINDKFRFANHWISTFLTVGILLTMAGCGGSSSSDDPEPEPPTNSAPTITSAAITTVEALQVYSYTLTASDADGDSLTMSSSALSDWLSFEVSTGILSGTPATSDVGEHSVTLSVSDGTAQTNQLFTIMVTAIPNNAPVITSNAILAATDGEAYSYTLTATDADGDTLSMSSTNTPAWLSFDDSTGTLSGTPATSDVGEHLVALSVTDGTDQVDQDFTISVSEAGITAPSALVIFDDAERADWPAWDCCGGSTPMEVIDADATYGATMEFSIGASPTVMGFTSRDIDGAVGGTPFDASTMSAEGTLVFDLKMTASPGATDWKFKIESNNAATAVEVNLSTSQEAHAAPVMDTWQRYTFNLADLAASGLDLSAIDVVMVFPAWDTGNGAVYRLDNVQILSDGNDGSGGGGDTSLVVFDDAERADWPAWDCCGGSTPVEVIDADATYGAAMEFSIGASPTVMGFTSREVDGAIEGTPFNAASISANGTVVFDLKMTASPGATDWKFKIESNNAATAVEVNLSTSQEAHAAPVMDTWQRYTFNLADLASAGLDLSAIDVVMIFPAWDTGNGAVYRLDNVQILPDGNEGSVSNGTQVDLPITFDEAGVDYTVIDFGGTASVLTANPVDAGDQVIMTTKTDSAATWAGTTMSTDQGLATVIPVTLNDSIMKVWVYSPDAGIPVRLKIENHSDPTQTVETESVTTTANAWEQLTFDFTNEAAGTEPLNPAIHPTWVFDKASIFFNFGTDGATAGEKVYYFDDVTFGE